MRVWMEMRVLMEMMASMGDEGLDGEIKKFLRLYMIVLVVACG